MKETMAMTPDQEACLSYTIAHFQEVARQNRFPENDSVPHDSSRCVICHPYLLPEDPFAIYLVVVTESIKARRPSLDSEFLSILNNDLHLMGVSSEITVKSILSGEADAVSCWRDWIRDALATGLGLISIHSPASYEFDLDEMEASGRGDLIDSKVDEIMTYQKSHAR